MRVNGHARKIVEKASTGDSTEVTRDDYILEVKDLMKRTRGCELPGTYNPLIIGELFREQCKPWRSWLERFSSKIFEAVDLIVNEALEYVVDGDTKAKLWGELINDGLDQLNRQLDSKVAEILRPHEDGHPITYNHYLTENVQKIRSDRYRDNVMRGLRESGSGRSAVQTNIGNCLEAVIKYTEKDMETVSSSEAIDWMEAYYKVALKHIVDDFSTLAVEACLISKLPGLFTPEVVFEFSDDTVSRVAAESWETADERKFLTDKMNILSGGMTELQRLNKYHKRIGVDKLEKEVNTPGSSSEQEKSWNQPDLNFGMPKQSEVPEYETASPKVPEEIDVPSITDYVPVAERPRAFGQPVRWPGHFSILP
ncbi:hypothetical protein F4813DRAFT_399790 [Daldinia decipiens]|uniref:uncharacterized protein n=1 Tax=Daldinia decipiens TaxID=326647 RepID=UPI0020C37A51|nr:uncharacterized protein F4813DRAFT_399790 [Daldinia decipiens]KAI1653438.1 hypothetical protein F4813DRAFT_399790 [Daldinia decipiens]